MMKSLVASLVFWSGDLLVVYAADLHPVFAGYIGIGLLVYGGIAISKSWEG